MMLLIIVTYYFLISFLKSTFLSEHSTFNTFIYNSPQGCSKIILSFASCMWRHQFLKWESRRAFTFLQTSKKTFTYCVDTLNPFGGEDLFFLLLHLSCSRRFMASRHENRGENKVTLLFYPDHKSYLRRKTVGSDIYYIEVANHCTHQGLLSDVSDVSVIVSVSFLLLRSTRQLSLYSLEAFALHTNLHTPRPCYTNLFTK